MDRNSNRNRDRDRNRNGDRDRDRNGGRDRGGDGRRAEKSRGRARERRRRSNPHLHRTFSARLAVVSRFSSAPPAVSSSLFVSVPLRASVVQLSSSGLPRALERVARFGYGPGEPNATTRRRASHDEEDPLGRAGRGEDRDREGDPRDAGGGALR